MTARVWFALAIGLLLGFCAALTIQNLLEAGERSKNKRSFADARTISDAIEQFREVAGQYPPVTGDATKLKPYLEPTYLRAVPTHDIYDRPYLVMMDGAVAVVISTGRNGFAVGRRKMLQGPSGLTP
jgi:type II secretory pathway pseudopilin PulG